MLSQMSVRAHKLWSRLSGRAWLSPRFDPVFQDGISLSWLKMNYEAYRRFHGVRLPQLTHVAMFAFSRGGSHLIESQFHFLRSCFCFGEGSLDFRSDVNWRTFLCRGMFRTDSIQDKSARELTHLFYNCGNGPAHFDKEQWKPNRALDYRRKWLLVLRNPLRILLSQHDTGKQKWKLNERQASLFFDWFERAQLTFRDLLVEHPTDTCIVSVEKVAAAPCATLKDMVARLEIDPSDLTTRPSPIDFFHRLSRTGEKPIMRNGYLASPSGVIRVQGWGGGFNPAKPVTADILFRHDLASALPDNIRKLARERIGARALEVYMSDSEHRYSNLDARDLLWL